MKMNCRFTVIARCNSYVNNGMEPEITEKDIDLELDFGIDECEKFLFRFSPVAFNIQDYKMVFKMGENNRLVGLSLFKDDMIYIVKNLNQIINDVLEGYINIRTMNKVSDVLNYDFDAAVEFMEPAEDEFTTEK